MPAARSRGQLADGSPAQRAAAPGAGERALVFSFNYPPLDGGISRLCAELVSGLHRRGIGVEVLSQRRAAAGSDVPPVPTVRVPMLRPWRELAAWRQLRSRDPVKPAICGVWYPEGLLATLAGVRPLVVLAHGLELNPTRQRWRRGLWRWLLRLVLGRAALVVANSRYTADLARRVAPGARLVALPLGVNHRRFCPGNRRSARRRLALPEDKRVIVTVSRIIANKGHRLVLTALASMPEDHRAQLVYLVAGQGPDRQLLEREADNLGLGSVVRWLGYVAEADLPQLYHSADLFVLCTRQDRGHAEVEGFGLAFLEAQACGIPVVGTRTGGIPDAVEEDRGGWLIDQDDVGALTAILSRLVASPAVFGRMGLEARQRVEREYTWDHYTERFIETLDRRAIPIG